MAGAHFAALDRSIIALDKKYDTEADAAAWAAAATSLLGTWALCANCQPDEGPKKLFRQWNFNREMQGQDDILTPSALVDEQAFDFLQVICGYSLTTGKLGVTLNFTGLTASVLIIAQVGSLASNPFTTIKATDSGPVTTGGPLWVWAWAIADTLIPVHSLLGPYNADFKFCLADPGGQPFTSDGASLNIFVSP